MNREHRETLLDCLSALWSLSKKSEDYWRHVASFEWEEALSYFSSLQKYPEQIDNLFGLIHVEEKEQILKLLASLTHKKRSQQPSFLEISLWACLIEAKSASMRREWFYAAYEIDLLSRHIVGAPSELSLKDLEHYLKKSARYVSLSKHLHPAFDYSESVLANKRDAA